MKKFVKVLFTSLDTNKDGKLSFQEFEKALLLEPKLARCFVPQTVLDNSNSKESAPRRSQSEMLPNSTKEISAASVNSVMNIITDTKKSTREDILAAITNTASSSSVTASHAVLGTDSQSAGCLCVVQ